MQLMSVDGQGSANQLLTRHQQPSERREELKPGRQLSVSVVYTPTSASVSLNALDITDLLHSKKYRVNWTKSMLLYTCTCMCINVSVDILYIIL